MICHTGERGSANQTGLEGGKGKGKRGKRNPNTEQSKPGGPEREVTRGWPSGPGRRSLRPR